MDYLSLTLVLRSFKPDENVPPPRERTEAGGGRRDGETEGTNGPPVATQEQMLGGWHSGPTDSNYRAKQSAERVSPHQSEEVD